MGLLDSVSDRKKDKDHLVTSKENIDDEFSKNMFGTEEVTVTVEYEGDENDHNDAELLQDEEQEVENKKDEEDEEYVKIIQNNIDIISIIWQNIVLEIPLRVVSEDANNSPVSGEGWKLIREDESNI